MYYTDGSAAGISSFGRRDNIYNDDGAFNAKEQKVDVSEREDVKDKNGMSSHFPYGSAFSQ